METNLREKTAVEFLGIGGQYHHYVNSMTSLRSNANHRVEDGKMTTQVHEILIYNGQESSMVSCPPMPEDIDTIIKISDDEIVKQIINGEIENIIFSTACWRRYIGTWEIKNDKLYLNDVVGRYKKITKDPLLAQWFSDVIIVPKEKLLCYDHMGFKSVNEKEVRVIIKNGKVVQREEICNIRERFNE